MTKSEFLSTMLKLECMYFLNQLSRILRISDGMLICTFKNVFHVDLVLRTPETKILREETKKMQRVQKFINLQNLIHTKIYSLS